MRNEFQRKVAEQWAKIAQIHNITKELYIKSEEYNEELNSFIQPIKELKDAYEHIVRAQANMYSDQMSEKYVLENLSKAIGHEYRAFFDTADFMGIILRNKIYGRLKSYSYNQICSVYPEYERARLRIMDITDNIASLRIRKDVGSSETMYQLIMQYKDIVYELLGYYKTIESDIYPKLETRFDKNN